MRTSEIPIFSDPGLPVGFGVATVEISPGVFRLRLVPLANLKGETGDAGTNGIDGATGATGATGPQGPTGGDGQSGGLSFDYLWDTGTGANPAVGELRINNALFTGANRVYANETTESGAAIANLLTAITSQSYLVIYLRSNPANFVAYRVGALIQNSPVVEFTVTYVSHNGAAFADGAELIFSVALAGADGVAGADGATGAPGSVWREGTGAPANGLGVNGDFYLEDVTGDVYQKAAGSYSVVANIKGPTGATGAYTHSTLAYSATTDLDFDFVDEYKSLTLAGNVTFTTSNRAAPKALTIRIIGDGSTRTFVFPAWVFIGSAAPASIAANKEALLTIMCFGANDTDVRAVYAVQP